MGCIQRVVECAVRAGEQQRKVDFPTVLANKRDRRFRSAREVEIRALDGFDGDVSYIPARWKGIQSRGDRLGAFAAVDRRCRSVAASARDFVARAALSRAMGDEASALADLRIALEHDPADVEANIAALRWGNADERSAAPARLIAGDCRNVQVLRAAIRAELAGHGGVVHRLRPSGAGVAGWLAWAGQGGLALGLKNADGDWTLDAAPNPSHGLAGDDYGVVDIAIPKVLEISDSRNGGVLFRRVERRTFDDRRATPPAHASALTVIVPIYDGFEATRDCLDSLFQQRNIVFSTILVDDASPDPRLSELANAAARRIGVTLLRNPHNLGFAGSVNRALAIRGNDDVVLLNADTLLPSLAISRLHALASDNPNLGTATPFSNNGQLTSFPRPFVVNPLPSAAGVEAIGELAWATHGAAVVDVPTGIGFCLYVTGACLDSVGVLPERYGRGYYEDAEFCAIARQHGFRNVCATGVFVGHAGSVSFKSDKPALTSRNLTILAERFPRQERQFLAFAHADPLHGARAAIEERLAPDQDCTLVVASEGRSGWQAQRRARDLEARGAAAIVLAFAADGGRVEFQRAEKGGPASSSFALDEAGGVRLSNYLRKLTVRAVEIFDVARAPDPLINALFGLGAPIDLFCVDLSATRALPAPRLGPCAGSLEPQICGACASALAPIADPAKERERQARVARVLGAARSVLSVDRMGAALARRVFGAKARALGHEDVAPPARPGLFPEPGAPPVLGVLAPVASVECDRLLVRLARKLASRRDGVAIVVLGASFNAEDLLGAGSAVVVGSADEEDWARLARLYGISRLALFDRTGLFGPLDGLARQIGAPKAYFDWSFGALDAEPGDLVLDPRVCDEKAAAAVANWLDSD